MTARKAPWIPSLSLKTTSKRGEVLLGSTVPIFALPHFPNVERFCFGPLFSVFALPKFPKVEKSTWVNSSQFLSSHTFQRWRSSAWVNSSQCLLCKSIQTWKSSNWVNCFQSSLENRRFDFTENLSVCIRTWFSIVTDYGYKMPGGFRF